MPARTAATIMKTARILIVDDEPLIRSTLAEYMTQEGFDLTACAGAEEALRAAAEQPFDVALCDVQMPGMDGIELLERLLKISPQTFVLLITAYATVENAVEAFQRGAHDYLMKPILLDEVLGKIRRLLAHRALYLENQWLRRELNRAHESDQMVGSSPAMARVLEMVRKVAPTRSTVLIVGESGTGKELVARVLAATNKDLLGEVEAGRFREDLYYRLNVVAIRIPPLRERREDIPELVEFLLRRHAQALGKRIGGVSHEAMQLLLACRWRGNVREL